MEEVLFKVPLTRWIRKTIDKMNISRKRDIKSWSVYWFETYKSLGGQSDESGNKGCPQHAAYGLWQLGRIKDSNIPYQHMSISSINNTYGKNATYAVFAIDLLEKGKAARNEAMLWTQVQELYRKTFHEEPAKSQQGAIKVALTLFVEGQIVTTT